MEFIFSLVLFQYSEISSYLLFLKILNKYFRLKVVDFCF
jgi:hypothetical protein